jgi:hypothetical protein
MENIDMGFLVTAILAAVVVFVIFKTAVVVPQQNAFVVESLGKYSRTLRPGFNILIPFIERVAYRHSLKENALDIQEQICITRDNVQVGVDGVLYLQVMNAERASYRDRQDRTRQDLRGAYRHQPERGRGTGQGLEPLGRQGAALRDQEHQSTAGRAVGDGKADARRTRETRRHPHLGG